jgi:predicted dehydrogenase
MSETLQNSINRRRLLKTTTLAAAGATLAAPLRAAQAGGSRKLRVGLVGCGGRGNFIAGLMAEHGGYEIVAGADYFQDRLDGFGAKFKVPAGKLFPGRSGFRKMIEDAGLDVVAIESPPYFHPEQAQAAVEAGKHVYVAKPVAVDVPGCLSIEQSGALATRKGLTFLVDFQTRADEFYQGAIRRLHDGAIGDLSWGESTYHAGLPFAGMEAFLKKDPEDPEMRLRAWGVDRVLSGDIITEQNIHTLDVASWIMNRKPLNATGSANRKVRGFGNCSDHFSVLYRFEGEVDISFTSRQYNGHGTQPDGIRNRMFGTGGVLECKYAGQVLLRAREIYRGQSPALYKTGPVTNIADFHTAVTKGDASNPTVAPSVESNLLTILGRSAAYLGRNVTWDEMMQANEALDPGLELKA